MSKHRKIPERIRKKLISTFRYAHASQSYLPAAKIFEKYRKLYDLDEGLMYNLGEIYDHIVFFNLKSEQKKLRLQYLKMAESIYRKILAKNPRSMFALHGIGRVYDARGDHDSAWLFAKRAYLIWKKSPKLKKGPLGTGNSFLLAGDFKKAEYWFKKELKELGPRNLSAQANLLILYNTAKKRRQAFDQAVITEKLLRRELKKPKNKRMLGRAGVKDETVRFVRLQIKKAKLNIKTSRLPQKNKGRRRAAD